MQRIRIENFGFVDIRPERAARIGRQRGRKMIDFGLIDGGKRRARPSDDIAASVMNRIGRGIWIICAHKCQTCVIRILNIHLITADRRRWSGICHGNRIIERIA